MSATASSISLRVMATSSPVAIASARQRRTGVSARNSMAQKFTNLDDAADQLSISKERLTQLREAGKVRAYRDGSSWKFRSEDIDKLVAEGLPQIDPGASDLSLDLDDLEISSSVG